VSTWSGDYNSAVLVTYINDCKSGDSKFDYTTLQFNICIIPNIKSYMMIINFTKIFVTTKS
jgi:hypothetical protein